MALFRQLLDDAVTWKPIKQHPPPRPQKKEEVKSSDPELAHYGHERVRSREHAGVLREKAIEGLYLACHIRCACCDFHAHPNTHTRTHHPARTHARTHAHTLTHAHAHAHAHTHIIVMDVRRERRRRQ